MKRHTYIKEELEEIVKRCVSIADVCRALNIRPVGGNYKTLKHKLKSFEIDTSHFTGQAWLLNKNHNFAKRMSLTDILKENSNYSSDKLRQRLIKEGYKQAECEKCRLQEWNGLPIPLELDHCNGNNTDNRLDNLKILCNNCHAQTENYRGRNKLSASSEKKRVEFFKFGETLTNNVDGNPELSLDKNILESVETLRRRSKVPIDKQCKECNKSFEGDKTKLYCSMECYNIARASSIPSVPQIIAAFENHKSFSQVGKFFGVSDNTVRKWLNRMDLWDMIKRKSSTQNSCECSENCSCEENPLGKPV